MTRQEYTKKILAQLKAKGLLNEKAVKKFIAKKKMNESPLPPTEVDVEEYLYDYEDTIFTFIGRGDEDNGEDTSISEFFPLKKGDKIIIDSIQDDDGYEWPAEGAEPYRIYFRNAKSKNNNSCLVSVFMQLFKK